MLSMMAEHVLETDIITIIPTFYNYQDIRTFYTVNTSQIFKVQYWDAPLHQSTVIISLFCTNIFISSFLCLPEL